MTQQHIEEFLKYASPRLDYIGHCMEKQAISAKLALPAIQAFRARASKGLIDPSRYKHIAELSESVGKLKGREKNQLKSVAGKLHKKYYDGNYVKGDYSRVAQNASAPTFEDAYFDLYGRMPDQDMIAASVVSPKVTGSKPFSLEEAYLARYGRMPEQIDAPKPKAPTTKSTTQQNKADSASNTTKATDSAPGTPNESEITNWLKEHPYLTAAGTTAGGSAFGTGLGYMLGNSSGSEETAQKLHNYYAINEALRRNALRSANSDILSRLANIFGAGDLNDLIG